MTDTEIIYPKFDTVNKIIYVNKYESFRYEVVRGYNGFFVLKVTSKSKYRPFEREFVGVTQEFSTKDFWMAAELIPSKAKHFPNRVDKIISSLIWFYHHRGMTWKAEVEQLIATFHRKYYENFYKGYHGFVEDWDTELEKFNGKEED